jgi:hypothetical protein
MRKTGVSLAKFYKIKAKSAYYHNEGNWYWNLKRFPGAYFDANGYVSFETAEEYRFRGLLHLNIGPENTGVRNKEMGMSISDIPGYTRLDPRPGSL